jgi:hypothetical protein
MTAKLTKYYMDIASKLLEEKFGNNLHIAIKVMKVEEKTKGGFFSKKVKTKKTTLKVGLYDGTDFLSVFGIVTVDEGSTLELTNSEGLIKTDFKDWVHMITEGIDWE